MVIVADMIADREMFDHNRPPRECSIPTPKPACLLAREAITPDIKASHGDHMTKPLVRIDFNE